MRRALHILLAAALWSWAGVASAAETGDAERGAVLWGQCERCHAVGPSTETRIGPHLNELFGRPAAAVEGYRYSKDMARAGADGMIWTAAKLDLYIENPRQLVTGTRMSYRGMPDPDDRRDLLAYLRQYTANPQDIPESAPTAIGSDPDVDPAILTIAGDRAYGEYLASECLTCHQATGSDRGIPSITGWPRDVFVTVMHAYKAEFRPHPVMQMMAQRLSDEEIASLAVYFEGVEE